ncbi:gamma-glutamyl-gamma-aminobutyrate hydrolase family protein [Microbacterium sp. LRZ72]|uniref:anthranilate synthase component II n=1 Tax=Microbacterium sp. LRZ72 TaxID=2942481 RepID=UPI0029A06CAD|nr:gamma-glutamyl-gamma-aminobutyrate hydrolase family protein [Microbacterium sp. LRZ72]MDX2376253.1 gamma-glutamyl-gamma-aminobutyrate hydrolase family protein [Microbacterium sp. LRZ72]
MSDVLVVDNDDSFVFTLCDYLSQLGARVDVVRSREIGDGSAAATIAPYRAVLLSPGPGAPRDAGASPEVVRAAAAARSPLLGVCLGHQAIAEVFGGRVETAPELMHGKVSRVTHDGEGLFAGLPPTFIAGRYHSLAVVEGSLPPDRIEVTARTDTGTIMALRHRTLPISGVQFHPESVLTEHGFRLLANWLASAGMPQALPAARGRQPLVAAAS